MRSVLSDGFETAKGSQTGDVGGHHRRAPRFRDKGHGAEVVELVGLRLINGVINGVLVGQVAVEEVELLVAHQVVDEATPGGWLRHAANKSVHRVPLLEKKFCEVGAVLAGDAGDHGGLAAHVRWQMVSLFKRSPQRRDSTKGQNDPLDFKEALTSV